MHDQFLVVALRLDKEGLYTFGLAGLVDPFTALLGAIGGIEDGNQATLFEPSQHVCQSSFGGRTTTLFTLGIGCVEEVCSRLRVIMAAVIAYVEDLGINGEPPQVSLSCAPQ